MNTSTLHRLFAVIAVLGICSTVIPTIQARPNRSLLQGSEVVEPSGAAQPKARTLPKEATTAPKNIVERLSASKNHTTLVSAVKAAGLVGTLSSPGPFTVFAPTNAAFKKLPAATVPNLLKPANKSTLAALLKYHVLKGKYSATTLSTLIIKGKGKATLKTVQGKPLTFTKKGTKVVIKDAKGRTSTVTTADLYQSNGIIHVVDTVLMP